MKKGGFFSKLKIRYGKTSAILTAVFAVLIAVDLILKTCEVAFDWNFTVIPGFIWVESGNLNDGAAFSFLGGTAGGRVFLTVFSCIMFIAVAAFFLLLPERFAVLKTALCMIGAGAIGNLVDRFAFGCVRDFVWMNLFGSWACCNFADFFIVLGVILAIIDLLFFNEWAVLPLTKGAKARVAARENRENEQALRDAAKTENAQSTDNAESAEDVTQKSGRQPEEGQPEGKGAEKPEGGSGEGGKEE